jgi:hypothetical protein
LRLFSSVNRPFSMGDRQPTLEAESGALTDTESLNYADELQMS